MRYLTLIAALAVLPTGLTAAEEVRIVTEDFWPFNYFEGAEVVGIGPDQIAEIADRTGIDLPVEIMPWSRALFLAENEPGTCVITTAQIAGRLDRFACVGPLATEENYLVRAVGSNVTATTLEEARPLRVGVVAGDFLASMLESQGFAALDVGPEVTVPGAVRATLAELKSSFGSISTSPSPMARKPRSIDATSSATANHWWPDTGLCPSAGCRTKRSRAM